ncbi:MAG: hypothetical protein GVY23_06245 [Spirochaetes bacterium]|jgi:hypothetical protein|nr:hypothetical protein [Spirochaetota bacterium]
MWHPKTNAFEKEIDAMLREVDAELEERYGDRYPLHPARAAHGETASGQHSGLFSVDAYFTPGYGSELGRGYVVDVEMVTLADVPDEVEDQIEMEAALRVEEKLGERFPERNLHVTRDGRVFKIRGDFSLGTV